VIFVTVGSQMPFRRLVQAADEWAQDHPGVEMLAQVGNDPSFRPLVLKTFASVSPERFNELVQACELLVAHAGMGSVLTALEYGKPMLLLPRRASLHETRNDHQVATLNWLQDKPGIHPAEDTEALKQKLDRWLSHGLAAPTAGGERPESLNALVETMRAFIG
jgi:UDP-N-acetylglucosamine transferase subunit ALG13